MPKEYTFVDGIFQFYTAHYGSWNNDRRIVFRVRLDTTPKVRAAQKCIDYYDFLSPSTEAEIALWFQDNPMYVPVDEKSTKTPEPVNGSNSIILFESSDILVYRKTGQQAIFVKNKKIEGCCIRVETYFGGLQVVAPESHLSPYSVHGLPAFQVQGGRNT